MLQSSNCISYSIPLSTEGSTDQYRASSHVVLLALVKFLHLSKASNFPNKMHRHLQTFLNISGCGQLEAKVGCKGVQLYDVCLENCRSLNRDIPCGRSVSSGADMRLSKSIYLADMLVKA